MWDVDPKDYRTSAHEIEKYIAENVKYGSIILLHDGGGSRDSTVAATENVIKKLKEKKYKFVTVSELIRCAN